MKTKKLNFIYLIVSIAAFLYVLIRAIQMDITYDEAWTLRDFVPQSVMHILNYTWCDANNHIVNTLLIKLLTSFHDSLFIARLPNVLAFILYLYFSYKIGYQFIAGWVGMAAFLLLILNPFLLDFFSIARGYGLSLGFQMGSLYFLLLFFREKKAGQSLFSLALGALAVLSNFTLLNYWIVLWFIICSFPVVSREGFKPGRNILNSLIVVIPLIALAYEPIRKLVKSGSLYYGGSDGFYSDTLVSLTKYTFYSQETSTMVYLALNLFLLFLTGSVIWSFFSRRFEMIAPKNIILCTLILTVLSVIVQHYLLGTLFLINRTALLFYPLLILVFCFSLNDFSKTWLPLLISGSMVFAFGLNFFRHANFHKTALWYFDSQTTAVLERLNEIGKKQNKKLKVDYSWPLQSSFGYYSQQNNYPFLDVSPSLLIQDIPKVDYYVYLNSSLEKVGYEAREQPVLTFFTKRDTVFRYQNEGIYIFSNIRE